jgi:hypothetical protein
MPVSLRYRLATALAALVIIPLPVIHLGLIVFLFWLAGHLLFANEPLIARNAHSLFAWMAYLGVPLGCVITAFFLVKPVLFPPLRLRPPMPLDPNEEPRLFEFVSRIADAFGAPRPTRVTVTLEVNTSAGVALDWRSVLGPPTTTLQLGLPLAAGLTVGQFAGVIAHEIGHFRQRGAARISNVILGVTRWFRRVALERDEFDDALRNAVLFNPFRGPRLLAGLLSLLVLLSRIPLLGPPPSPRPRCSFSRDAENLTRIGIRSRWLERPPSRPRSNGCTCC